MAICFVNGVFVRKGEQLVLGGSHIGLARIDEEIMDEQFAFFRGDLSVTESDNGGLTIVPSCMGKNTDAVWLFVCLPRGKGCGRYPRNAYLVASGRQDINCWASFDYLQGCNGELYDVVIVKAMNGDRFCYLNYYGAPHIIGICGGYVDDSLLADPTMEEAKGALGGMFVFTGHFDEIYPENYWRTYEDWPLPFFSEIFNVAECVYCGFDVQEMGDIQPDPAGLAVV